MSPARHMGTERLCPDCEGCGCSEERVGISDYKYHLCEPCNGRGWIDWREAKCGRDPLESLRDWRTALRSATGRGLHFYQWRYREVRAAAMALVDLPDDDLHLLVSPETAAYFNAQARKAAA